MICYLNGFDDAKEKLIEAKPLWNPIHKYICRLKKPCGFWKMKYDVQWAANNIVLRILMYI
jgi:hypothetical protein